MSAAPILEREEYVEQAYFFRVLRARLVEQTPAQEALAHLQEEVLTSTRMPVAIGFLATELKHTGLLASGFARLPHYFTPFQTFVVGQAEEQGQRFAMPTALLVLEREATYKAGTPTMPGLFVYQFEALARNRLGYTAGLTAMAADPHYDAVWREFLGMVHRQVGVVDFGELLYLRSELYVKDQRRQNPAYEPPVPPVFGEKEGRIAKASRGRDPLYLFAALQRQLAYPEVPRSGVKDPEAVKLDLIQQKLRELEMRLKLAESELRGNVDLTQFGKPEMFKDDPDGA